MLKIAIFLISISYTLARVEIPPDLQEYIDDLHEDCIKKSEISEDDHKSYELINKDPKMMCYMKCLMVDSKWMSPSGTIQYDFIIESAHSEVKHILLPALEKCRDIPEGMDQCEKAYNFNVCMKKADPENWFLV